MGFIARVSGTQTLTTEKQNKCSVGFFFKLLSFLKRKKKRVREKEKKKQNRIRKENLDETNRLVSFAGWVLFGILFLFKSLELSETPSFQPTDDQFRIVRQLINIKLTREASEKTEAAWKSCFFSATNTSSFPKANLCALKKKAKIIIGTRLVTGSPSIPIHYGITFADFFRSSPFRPHLAIKYGSHASHFLHSRHLSAE